MYKILSIGSDFPDEFVHSKDTHTLKGANLYAKANASGIRHDQNGKLYIYDVLRIKKETSKPPTYPIFVLKLQLI